MLKVSCYIQESGLCRILTISSENKIAIKYLRSYKFPNTGQNPAVSGFLLFGPRGYWGARGGGHLELY